MKDTRTRVVGFTIKHELLRQALKLPDGVDIVGAEWDWAAQGVRLFVRSNDFASIPFGEQTPIVHPIIREKCETKDVGNNETEVTVTYEWDFNLPVNKESG